ncbi:MAG TPA: hypothetical protein VK698_07580 [Kofleriaceae bacterium]|nr:hypothetical protein [Kofleriaceae bacterium]
MGASGDVFLLGAPAFLAFAYFFLVWDARRADSPNKDDGQIGIKLVLYFFIIVGVGIAAGGLATLLNYLLSGAKTGTPALKQGLADLVSGVVPIFVAAVVLLPRTNFKQYTRAGRLAYGFLAASGGFMAWQSLHGLVGQLIQSAPWASTSGQLANLVVFGGIGFFALFRLGSLSSWSAPVRPAPMAPTHSQGYPQGGGYPPQGYPPQGYPQGGGYGGGGGYGPQQGGGGYPPGGGYQPR